MKPANVSVQPDNSRTLYRPEGMPDPPPHLTNAVLYLLYEISEGLRTGRVDDSGFVTLQAKRLQAFDRKYKAAKGWLIDAGVISVNGYTVGDKSNGFKIVAARPWHSVSLPPDVGRKLATRVHKEVKSLGRIPRYLHSWLNRVELDLPRAESIINQLGENTEQKAQLLAQCLAFNSDVLPLTVCEFGHRAHTPATNLQRELRTCFTFNGIPLVPTDIANCQPSLLIPELIESLLTPLGEMSPRLNCGSNSPSLLVPSGSVSPRLDKALTKNNHYQPPTSPYDSNGESLDSVSPCFTNGYITRIRSANSQCIDVWKYIELCEAGLLYEHLMQRWGKPVDRDEFKVSFFQQGFFSKRVKAGQQPRGLARLFKQEFPNVWAVIQDRKFRCHKDLSKQMQRLESRIIIKGVCGRLKRDYPDIPVITVHDSILTTPDNLSTVESIIKEEFNRFGIFPTLKRK